MPYTRLAISYILFCAHLFPHVTHTLLISTHTSIFAHKCVTYFHLHTIMSSTFTFT